MLPFPTAEVKKVLLGAKKLLMLETNFDSQMAGVIAQNTGILIQDKLLRYDGRPIHPAQILEKICQTI